MIETTQQISSINNFFIKSSEIEDRIDPYYYKPEFKNLVKELRKNPLVKSLKSMDIHIKKGVFDMSPNKYVEKGVPFLRVADITYEGMNFTSTVFISENTHNEEIKTEFLPGDIVIAKIGHTIGKISILPNDFEKYNISQNVVGVKISEDLRKILNPEYLKVFLSSSLGKKQIIRHSSQGAQPKITLDSLRKIILPVFSIEKQQTIVDLYFNALNNKKNKEKEAEALLERIDTYLLEQLEIEIPSRDNSLKSRVFKVNWSETFGDRLDGEYSQTYFREITKSVFEGKYKPSKIKAVTSFVESGSRPKGGVGQISSGVFSIGGEHVNDKCQVGIGKPKFIPIEYHDKIKATETKLYDIILVKDGATTGKVGIIDSEKFTKQNINEHVFLIRPEKDVISPHFLVSYLFSSVGQVLLKRYITGATVTGITKEALRNILIPLPSLEKQNEITEHIFELRNKAKQLEIEAENELKEAKLKIEGMILG